VITGTIVETGSGMSNQSSLGAIALALGFVVMSAAAAAAQSADAGKRVYDANKCSICHSVAGVGNKKGPLEDAAAKLSADQIRQWIVDAPAMSAKSNAARKPPMKAYTLPKEEVDALVAYVQSLKK
jgi:mono/diheme cytochrome c family protein